MLDRITSRKASVADGELAEDGAHVGVNRSAAEKEGLSNLRITETPSDET